MEAVFREPFWRRQGGTIPDDKRPFADAMNFAIQKFMMTAVTNVETFERLLTAYVEGEKYPVQEIRKSFTVPYIV